MDIEERDGDYICNVIGIIVALYDAGIMGKQHLPLFDLILSDIPPSIASRIGVWINHVDVKYPCSSRDPLVSKINASASAGQRVRMTFLLDKLDTNTANSQQDMPQ
jgi:hypothetical protein